MSAKKDSIAFYNTAVKAVQPSILLPQYIRSTDTGLVINACNVDLNEKQKLYVIGAGNGKYFE